MKELTPTVSQVNWNNTTCKCWITQKKLTPEMEQYSDLLEPRNFKLYQSESLQNILLQLDFRSNNIPAKDSKPQL